MSDKLEIDTKKLIDSIFNNSVENEDETLKVMKREINLLFDKHRRVYSNMIDEISSSKLGISAVMEDTIKKVFSDGSINWGRIVSLITFGVLVADYLKTNDGEHEIVAVKDSISSYLINHQKEWLLKNNAWKGFVDFFQVTSNLPSIKSSLTVFIALISFGAVLYSFFNLTTF